MEKKVVVVINEEHKLLAGQVSLLDDEFGEGNWARLNVPAKGWTYEEQLEMAGRLMGLAKGVVFASPLPALLKLCAFSEGLHSHTGQVPPVWVFHNDNRAAKEVPDGKGGVKVIHTVAPDGWQLV